ncbi:MAG: hypothetical protein AAGH15_18270 [Myxococcota bacterium]
MSRSVLAMAAAVCAGLLLALATGPGVRAQDGPETLDVDDVRPGMRGYGLSVFRGTEPERFDVEVIDVLHDFRPGQDIVLARTPHPLLDHAGSVGGMSGSPIYLEGKLLGAYAYGWPFGRDPIIGITPIRNMLAEMRRPTRPDSFPGARPLARRARRPEPRPARLAGLPAYRGGPVDALGNLRAHGERHGWMRSANTPALSGRPVPAMTPLMLGAFSTAATGVLEDVFAPFGMMPLQGGGSGRAEPGAAPPRFVDGGSLGVQLIRGDMAAMAIGTATYVGPGRRVVGWGHPMMNAGETGLPTCTARVLHVLASLARSFKIAEASQPFGALVHDRPSTIVVDTELEPATIPVTIRVSGVPDAPKDRWSMEVAGHRLLTPPLLLAGIVNAIETTASDQTDVSFVARTTVDIEGIGPVSLEDRGATGAGAADVRALTRLRLFQLVEAAYGNPFGPSRIRSVELEMDLSFGNAEWEIIEASVASAEVDPGAEVPIRVVLRRYGSPDAVRTVRVRVPESAAGGRAIVRLTSGPAARPPQGAARSLEDMVRIIGDVPPATSLVASVQLPQRGLRFRGHVVEALPRSALDSLQRVSGTGPGRPFVTYARQVRPLGELITGSAQLTLDVRERPRD